MNQLELYGNYYKMFKGNGGMPEKVTTYHYGKSHPCRCKVWNKGLFSFPPKNLAPSVSVPTSYPLIGKFHFVVTKIDNPRLLSKVNWIKSM